MKQEMHHVGAVNNVYFAYAVSNLFYGYSFL